MYYTINNKKLRFLLSYYFRNVFRSCDYLTKRKLFFCRIFDKRKFYKKNKKKTTYIIYYSNSVRYNFKIFAVKLSITIRIKK